MSRVCVCALLYGNDSHCEKLGNRLLNDEFVELGRYADVRIGMNAVSDNTRLAVKNFVNKRQINEQSVIVVDCPENINKYPMMRRLFDARPILAPLTMWFDDDSCIVPGTAVNTWLDRVTRQLTTYAMIGSVYMQSYSGGQREWIKAQPWYKGTEPARCLQYVAGGWWAARTEVLLQLNWPPAELKNRGGDMMLGEALRQQGFPIGHFRDNLWISANEDGVESKSPRRGGSEIPIGVDYATI